MLPPQHGERRVPSTLLSRAQARRTLTVTTETISGAAVARAREHVSGRKYTGGCCDATAATQPGACASSVLGDRGPRASRRVPLPSSPRGGSRPPLRLGATTTITMASHGERRRRRRWLRRHRRRPQSHNHPSERGFLSRFSLFLHEESK